MYQQYKLDLLCKEDKELHGLIALPTPPITTNIMSPALMWLIPLSCWYISAFESMMSPSPGSSSLGASSGVSSCIDYLLLWDIQS